MYKVNKISNAVWKKYAKSNLPLKYIDHRLEDFRVIGDNAKEKAHNQSMFDRFMDYYENVEEHLKNGQGLMICGPVGVAKTWLMTHLAKQVITVFENENAAIIEQDLDIDSYRNSFYCIQATTLNQMVFTSGLNEKELNIRRGVKTVAGLWIDDISKMSETKSGVEISFLDDILRYRDLNGLTTFYTSQLPFETIERGEIYVEGLDKALSKPIHDLIRGNTTVLTFRGDSQR